MGDFSSWTSLDFIPEVAFAASSAGAPADLQVQYTCRFAVARRTSCVFHKIICTHETINLRIFRMPAFL